jgi:hypothetical protein
MMADRRPLRRQQYPYELHFDTIGKTPPYSCLDARWKLRATQARTPQLPVPSQVQTSPHLAVCLEPFLLNAIDASLSSGAYAR